eukprot:c20738_g3_i4.p1 GENE.c20738_g3_i4~~c20738_g3_i4.p1  ORF type:complete len:251 (+),score=62.65 c20738_g3_i4:317-1069(+)
MKTLRLLLLQEGRWFGTVIGSQLLFGAVFLGLLITGQIGSLVLALVLLFVFGFVFCIAVLSWVGIRLKRRRNRDDQNIQSGMQARVNSSASNYRDDLRQVLLSPAPTQHSIWSFVSAVHLRDKEVLDKLITEAIQQGQLNPSNPEGFAMITQSICRAGHYEMLTDTVLQRHVKEIDLSRSDIQIEEEGALRLADVLRVNSTITKINLSNNDIGETGTRALFAALCANTTLTSLNVSNNTLGHSGAIELGR